MSRNTGSIELAVCLNEVAEVPFSWRDDCGDLLPEFSDEFGGIRLPVQIDGKEYDGYDGEYLTGDLVPHPNYGTVSLTSVDMLSVKEALEYLNWEAEDADVVLQALTSD